MHEFMISYAPVIMIIASIAAAFWIAPKDEILK